LIKQKIAVAVESFPDPAPMARKKGNWQNEISPDCNLRANPARPGKKCDECCGAKQRRMLPTYSAPPRRVTRKMSTTVLFTLADPEHFGATGWTQPLGGGSAVFHRNFLGIFHFFFGFAFHTISLHLVPPLIFLNPQNVSRKIGVANKL
jgi:hypothetical protein